MINNAKTVRRTGKRAFRRTGKRAFRRTGKRNFRRTGKRTFRGTGKRTFRGGAGDNIITEKDLVDSNKWANVWQVVKVSKIDELTKQRVPIVPSEYVLTVSESKLIERIDDYPQNLQNSKVSGFNGKNEPESN